MINDLKIDVSLVPKTLDAFHIGLAGAVLLLALILVVVLLMMVVILLRKPKAPATVQAQPAPVAAKAEPEVKIIEKIIEKPVPAPTPEPVVLKESSPDAALHLLSLLQKEARFIDFIKEDITAYNDADVGAAARVVHEGCVKAIDDHFTLAPVRMEQENSRITLPKGFDAAKIRLTGNIVGEAPFTGTLIHKGWEAIEVRLPKTTEGHNVNIIAAAEVEL
ncbi:MAG: DUF2760 domain-containing protein [Gammaproteobacteria bacterium]